MKQFIVSDIFGRTKALDKLVSELPYDIDIIDPYDSRIMAFENEQEAYSYFTNKVGLDSFTEKLLNIVTTSNNPVRLIGFSVGASAIWKLSSHAKANNVIGAVLFYSSQIRHYTEATPLFPITLVFPKTEKNFLVTDIIAKLSEKENVQIHRSNYLHGFMNFHSKNYNTAAYKKYKQAMCNAPFNKPIQATAFCDA